MYQVSQKNVHKWANGHFLGHPVVNMESRNTIYFRWLFIIAQIVYCINIPDLIQTQKTKRTQQALESMEIYACCKSVLYSGIISSFWTEMSVLISVKMKFLDEIHQLLQKPQLMYFQKMLRVKEDLCVFWRNPWRLKETGRVLFKETYEMRKGLVRICPLNLMHCTYFTNKQACFILPQIE